MKVQARCLNWKSPSEIVLVLGLEEPAQNFNLESFKIYIERGPKLPLGYHCDDVNWYKL